MSISSELLTLQNTKTAIRTAINNKGGSVGASDTFASYATAIDNLPSGGSGNPLLTSIDVSDFTGVSFDAVASYITDVTIPSGVTTIQNNAFENCGLTTITIPNSVTTIGSYAFYQSKLTSITIPSTVRTLGQNVFQYCTNLTSITLPNNITVISVGLLSGCSSLTNYTIPETVTTIQNSAFENCGLTTIIIPSSVTTIGYGVFQGCSRLTRVIVNATTPPTLDANVFNNTNNCPIYVPAESVEAYKTANNWSTYASRIFAIEDSILFTPTNGDPAISVKNYELATANYVQSTDVPSTIKNGAGSLEIGEGVTRIGTFVFQNGSSLTSVTIPSTITRIDNAAFDGCSSLTSITVNATTPPTLYAAAFDHTNDCPIYVPAESVETYQAASGWSTYASRIEAIQEPVEETSLVLPDTATISLSNDVDAETFETRIPVTISYANGNTLPNPYYDDQGTPISAVLDNEGWCSAYLSDGETDVSDYFGIEWNVEGGTYEIVMYFSDDNETLVDWAVSGEEVTLDIALTLPDLYTEDGEGGWVSYQTEEQRTGTMTITLDT